MNVPILVHICEAAPRMEARIFLRSQSAELQGFYAAMGATRIPVFTFLDEQFNALGTWVYVDPAERTLKQMAARRGRGAPAIPRGFRRFIGVAEMLAAAGLVLPGLMGILPVLTPLAAGGLMIVMAGVVVYPLFRAEFSSAVFTGILFLIVTGVAYARIRVAPL